MDDSPAIDPPSGKPDAGSGCLAMAIAGTLVSVPITMGFGWASAWPFVWIVTLFIVTILGVPAFLLIRLGHRARWLRVCLGGFAVGALFPALGLLPGNGPAPHEESVVNAAPEFSYWSDTLLSTVALGLAGVAGALMTWLLLGWFAADRAAPPRQHLLRSGALAGLIAASLAGAALYQWAKTDRSCHNLQRHGEYRSEPVAAIQLHIGPPQWPGLRDELERFARATGWSLRTHLWPNSSVPYFSASLCTEAGTRIDVMYLSADPAYVRIAVDQPQGGDSWQAPFHALQRQLEARWPSSVRYDEGANASPRPPWAPPLPVPSPSPAATGGAR